MAAADLPAVLPAVTEAAAAAALAAGGGRRAGAFIRGQAMPAKLKLTMVQEPWSNTLRDRDVEVVICYDPFNGEKGGHKVRYYPM